MSHAGKMDEESGGHYATDYYSVVKKRNKVVPFAETTIIHSKASQKEK